MGNNDFKAHKKLGEFKTFGEYIKEGMEKKDYSIDMLEDMIAKKGYEISGKQIKYWQKDAAYPDITMIYVLAELLELNPNELLLAKQYMQEAGLSSIDMMVMRVVCNLIDTTIWKIHQIMTIGIWVILLILYLLVWRRKVS